MNSCERITFISTLACSLFNSLSTKELEILAATLTQLGDTLTTMLINQAICEKKNNRYKKYHLSL